MEHPIKAVIFDIDGTVTPNSNSWLAMTRDMGASVEEHKAIFFEGFKEGKVHYDQVRERLIALWRATGNANRSRLETIFQNWPVHDDAKKIIDFFRDKGLQVAFITGSTSMYAKIVADKFGVADFYASGQLEFDEDDNLVDFHFPLDESERKLEHLVAYCEGKSINLQEVVALGDSNNDVAIFSATKRGIIVGKDRPQSLIDVAWKEASSLREAKEILLPYLEN